MRMIYKSRAKDKKEQAKMTLELSLPVYHTSTTMADVLYFENLRSFGRALGLQKLHITIITNKYSYMY